MQSVTASALPKSFQAWKQLSSKPRSDTELCVTEFLREAYPAFHVTRVSGTVCNLLQFADAGFATATQVDDGGRDSTRNFTPARRLEGGDGKLTDNVGFGRWLYTWNDIEFIVYQTNYPDRYMRSVQTNYILAPYTDINVKDDHHFVTDALILVCGNWTKELHEEIEVFDNSRWQKSKELYSSIKDSTWDDVILDPTMKANLIRDVQDFFNNREIYNSLNVPWKRGVIFHGIPGNGKTVSIKALVSSLATRPDPVPSLYVKSLDSCNGSKWSIKAIFEHARKMSPCLLIFEDLDSMVEDKVRSYFLNEVDGLDSNEGILMIGSTNHLSDLDSSITKRPSRFDRKYHFKLPEEPERIAYCRYWQKKFLHSETVDFPEELCAYAAKLTEGFSFAYLKELFISALLALARGGESELEQMEVETDDGDDKSIGVSSETVIVEKVPEATESMEKSTKETLVAGLGIPTDAPSKEKKAKKPKRVLPNVEIPEGFEENLLLQIVKAQAKALLSEMDNSEEEAEERRKKPAATSCEPTSMFGRAIPNFLF